MSGGKADRLPRIGLIATREPAYSRVAIMRKSLRAHFDVVEILSDRKAYWQRMIVLVARLAAMGISGRLRKLDALVVGFFAQPLFPLIRLVYRGPIIADCYFSLYDTFIHDKKKARPGSWIARLCHWLDGFMLDRATLSVTDTREHVEYLKKEFGVRHAEIRRLWIGADCGDVGWNAPAPSKDRPFDVFFWGGFIPLQGVEVIVRAAALLHQAGENFRFTIFGTGQTELECRKLARVVGAENVRFEGWQSPAAIANRGRESHLALGIFGTTDKASRVIPNKAFEALAMGLPLVTRKSPAADELLGNGQHALLVEPGNPQALADALLWCRSHWQEVCQMAARGQEHFIANCSQTEIDELLRQIVLDGILLHEARRQSPAGRAKTGIHPPIASSPAGRR